VVELIREAARRRGIQLQWILESHLEEHLLNDRSLDLWPLITITPERLRTMHITEPYLETELCFLVRESSPYRQAGDLGHATVSLSAQPIDLHHLRALLPAAQPVPHTDERDSLQDVCQGHSDGVLMETNSAVGALLRGGSCAGVPLRWIAIPGQRLRLGIGSSFVSKAVADGLREEIGSMAAQGKLVPAIAQWEYLSGARLDQILQVLSARRRERWLIGGISFSLFLMALAVWQTVRFRREARRARRAEQAQREIEQRLRLLTNGLKDMVLAFDMERRLIYSNPAVELLTGWTADELRTRGFIHWVHPEDRERMQGFWDHLFEGATFQDVEYRLMDQRGGLKWVSATWGPLIDESGRQIGVQGLERDITERRSADTVLHESEERYRSLFERSLDCVFLLDFQGQLLDANQAALDLLGYRREEIATLTLASLMVGDQLTSALQEMEEIRLTGRQQSRTEYRLTRKDGSPVVVEIQSSLICRDGKPHAVQGIARDITGRKRAEAEREKLWAQLTQAQKMECVGRLAGGVAHDFNNLLTVINGYSDMVLSKLSQSDPVRSSVEEIRKAGERARGLTGQLLTFSRKQVLKSRMLDLNSLLTEMRPMLARLLGEDVELSVDCDAAAATLFADPHQLEQVIMNLAVNARDAMPAGGKLFIRTYNT